MRFFIFPVAWLALLISSAEAHAFLDHAAPKVGGTVAAPLREVRLWFTEQLEPALSTAQILDRGGQAVPKQVSAADPKDAAVLVVTFPALPPGKYRVAWRAISVDTHVTKGGFSFTVTP